MNNDFRNPITGRYMKKSVAWVNRFGDEFELKDIDDKYLLALLICIAQGIGYDCITSNKDKINDIYKEAYSRKIINYAVIFNLHSWALYKHGFEKTHPSWFFMLDNSINN
jgi:hypothetical protein